MNLADLRRTLGVDGDGGCGGMGNSTKGHASEADDDGLYGADSKARRRLSMERMDLLKVCLCLAAFVALLFFWFFASFFVPHPWSLPLFIITTLGRWEFYWRPSKTYHYQFYLLAWAAAWRFYYDFIIIIIIVFLGPFQFWLLALSLIQLTPDVKQLHSKGRRELHEMDPVWPRPFVGHPVVRRDMLPPFVSFNNPLLIRLYRNASSSVCLLLSLTSLSRLACCFGSPFLCETTLLLTEMHFVLKYDRQTETMPWMKRNPFLIWSLNSNQNAWTISVAPWQS